MDTYFAPAERASKTQFLEDIHVLAENPIVDSILGSAGGLIAVLNEHRQILAINESLLNYMGIDNPQDVLQLRPGESLQCIHAHDMEGGCGTSMYCPTCGVAIAIMATLRKGKSEVMTCGVTASRNGNNIELFFRASSSLLILNGKRLVLLFLQDITKEHRYAALERVFFHDINNIITSLLGKCELLSIKNGNKADPLVNGICKLAARLTQEVRIQQYLARSEQTGYKFDFEEVSSLQVCEELHQVFDHHPCARNKILTITEPSQPITLKTNLSLLLRVIGNMVLNAIEASATGEEVKVRIERDISRVVFSVWNTSFIPVEAQKRIFMRHFSTKQELGRGIGTYSMKLFGEEFLGGKVDFTSSKEDGTTFRFFLEV